VWVEGLKALVTHHNLTVTDKSWSWEDFRQDVSDNVACTKREKLDRVNKGKFTDAMSVNVDVSGVFATDWIDGQDNTR
jgi:hypothetical protein